MRYIIERKWDVEEDQMPAMGRRSKLVATEQFPNIVWEHSHVVVDADGNLKSFCVYESPDEETVRAHAGVLGSHAILNIYEIGGDVTPDDFPL